MEMVRMPRRDEAPEPPPAHLAPSTRAWFAQVLSERQMEPHQIKLLTLAGEAWDRGQQAREALAEHGLVFADRFGAPRPRPEVAIERDARLAFAKLVRELGLDADMQWGRLE
jgi:phage terminase small subunit